MIGSLILMQSFLTPRFEMIRLSSTPKPKQYKETDLQFFIDPLETFRNLEIVFLPSVIQFYFSFFLFIYFSFIFLLDNDGII